MPEGNIARLSTSCSTKILESFKAHIFFDDQDVHLKTSSLVVPSGKVLYPTNSPLAKIQK